MKHLIAVCSALLVIVCATPLFADTPTEEQMTRLVQVLGIQGQLEAQRNILVEQNQNLLQRTMETLARSHNMNQGMLEEHMQKDMEHFLVEANKAYDTDSMTRDYARLMRKQLSAADVKKLIAFYESELGALYVKADIAITEPLLKNFTEEYKQRMGFLMQGFIADMTRKIMDMQQKKNDGNQS